MTTTYGAGRAWHRYPATARTCYFRRAAGTTFSAVVKRYRLELACRLLTLTAAPIATIAQEVGFNNLSNFNRQFRAAHGLTPSAYRAREVANRQSAELLPYRTEQ